MSSIDKRLPEQKTAPLYLKVINIALIILTLGAMPAGVILALYFGDVYVFGVLALIEYSPLFFILSIVGVGLLLQSIFFKYFGYEYKSSLLIAILVVPLCLIMGSFSLMFSRIITAEDTYYRACATQTNLTLPENVKILNQKMGEYVEVIARIDDESEREEFYSYVLSSEQWEQEYIISNSTLLSLVEYHAGHYNYFYNQEEGLVLAYNVKLGSIIIFTVNK